jgi:hypothetical protein
MKDILNEGVLITLRYQASKPEKLSERTPDVNNIHFTGITIRNSRAPVAIYGLEERNVSRISFSAMKIVSQKGILLENTSGIRFHDITMEVKEGTPLEAKDSEKITWDMVSVTTPATDRPWLKFTNCREINITNCYQPESIPVFITEDEKSEVFNAVNNILPGTTAMFSQKGKNLNALNNVLKK